MKFVTLVLAAYILCLSLQPCGDSIAPIDAQGHEIEKVMHIDTPQDAENSDDCSPFCICSCCSHPAASRFFAFTVNSESDDLFDSDKPSIYRSPYNSSTDSSIWQPPKA